MFPKQDRASMNAFYGNPDKGNDGLPDRDWEAKYLTTILPPYPMVLAWDTARTVKKITVNKMCSDSLHDILTEIGQHFGPEGVVKNGLHLFGGTYAFRLKRGGSSLSNHSWGSAIDLDPANNAMGSHRMRMPSEAIRIFERHGWTWGGHWRTPDGMHFQAASL